MFNDVKGIYFIPTLLNMFSACVGMYVLFRYIFMVYVILGVASPFVINTSLCTPI